MHTVYCSQIQQSTKCIFYECTSYTRYNFKMGLFEKNKCAPLCVTAQYQPKSRIHILDKSLCLKTGSFQSSLRSTTMHQLMANKAAEWEITDILYSSLLPVYIIPTVSHQGSWMKSFHQLSPENLFSSLKLNPLVEREHRCSTFTKLWTG